MKRQYIPLFILQCFAIFGCVQAFSNGGMNGDWITFALGWVGFFYSIIFGMLFDYDRKDKNEKANNQN
jgi:hypothetical protein